MRSLKTLHAWFRLLRPHQWVKNLLLLLPAGAVHIGWQPESWLQLIVGIAAFSTLASATYIINDFVDRFADRQHPVKRHRPLAAAEVSLSGAWFGVFGLGLSTLGLSWFLPPRFGITLVVYLVLTLAYTFLFKKQIILDVIVLSTLYTIRVVAGAAILEIPLSRWFLAFSIFLFFSLALVKRVIELQTHQADSPTPLSGRGYVPADQQVLTVLGIAAAVASSLVYCLYITSADVVILYSRPDYLWIGLPLLLYWKARIWLLALRHAVHEDPILFALRDRVSYAVISLFLFIVWLAS